VLNDTCQQHLEKSSAAFIVNLIFLKPMNFYNIRRVTFVLLIPIFLFSVVGYYTENGGFQMAGVITAIVFLIRAWVEATSPSSTDKHS
jgi:hypothetical protein